MKNIVNINNKFIKSREKLDIALDFIKNTDFSKLKDGRVEIKKPEIWANLQTYQTKSDAYFEAHRRYIDLQYIISGEEKIGVCNYSDCTKYTQYDENNDIEFLDSDKFKNIQMKAEDFLILYPTDAHKPSISIDKNNTSTVRKLVIKIRID